MKKLIRYTTLPRLAENHLLLLLTLLLTFAFIMTGSKKVMADPTIRFALDLNGYPFWFMVFLGYAEIFGAISLWIRRWAVYGAMGLTLIMLGATRMHFFNGDPIAIAGMAYILTLLIAIVCIYHWRAVNREVAAATGT